MAITIYTCDACARKIELIEPENSFTLVNNCLITKNCKGTLKKTGSRDTGVFGAQIPVVDGLENYERRPRLYVHNQGLSSSVWRIQHNLKCNPIIFVYLNSVENGKQGHTQLDSDQYVIEIIDENNIVIEFAENYIGVAHILSQSQSTNIATIPEASSLTPITANTIITIATPILVQDQSTLQYDISFITPSTSEIVTINATFTAHKFETSIALFDSPWRNVQLITWNDTIYRVRSARITNLLAQAVIEAGSPFYFTNDPNILILTSNEPYEQVADISQRVILPVTIPKDGSGSRITSEDWLVDTSLLFEYPPGILVLRTIQQ